MLPYIYPFELALFDIGDHLGGFMKNVPKMLCKIIVLVIASPFLMIGFLIWMIFGDDEPCKGCTMSGSYCSECKENPERKKNRSGGRP